MAMPAGIPLPGWRRSSARTPAAAVWREVIGLGASLLMLALAIGAFAPTPASGMTAGAPAQGSPPTLVPDVAVSASIGALGEADLYTFTLATSERVVLQATGAPGVLDPCVRVLVSETGPPVTGGVACGVVARVDVVVAAGTYFVEIADNFSNHAGPYTLLYQPVVASSAVALAADVGVSSSITPLGDLDLYTFTLSTAERVVLQATGAPGVLDPCLRVLTGAGGPAVTGGTTCGVTARLDLTLAAGTYFVEVSDNFNNHSGPYTLLYEPVVASSAAVLTADVAVSTSITPLGDLDLYTFTLSTAERVVLQATGAPGVLDPCVRVLTGAGGPPVTGGTTCGVTARLDLMLAAGTYFVEVSDNFNNHTGPYTLLYQPVLASTAVALTADVGVSSSVTPLGDLDLYRFTLATAERVVLQATGAPGVLDPCVRVLTGTGGAPVSGGATCGVTARLDLSLTAGTYFVEVSDNFNNHAGPYTLFYQPVVAATAIPLTSGATLNDTIAPLGDLDLFVVTLATAEHVVLVATGAPGVLDPCLRVLTAPGQPPVTGGTACGVTARVDITLAAGTYFVEVSDNFNNHSGPYTISFQPGSTANPTPLPLDTPQQVTVSAGAQLPFDVTIGSGAANLFIRLQKDTAWRGTVSLYLAGTLVATTTGMTDHILQLQMPAPGTYRLLVSGPGAGTGVLTASTSLPALTLGQPTIGTMRRQWGNAWYQVDVPANQQQLSFAVEMLGIASRIDVWYGRVGGTPRWAAAGDRITLRIPTPAAGRYYVQLFDSGTIIRSASQARDHRILADVIDISPPPCTSTNISGFSPTRTGTGVSTLAVHGTCFDPNARLRLWLVTAFDYFIDPRSVVVDTDQRTLRATFDLSGAIPGQYTLVVFGSAQPVPAVPGTLEITAGGTAGLWVDLAGRRQVRAGRSAHVTLTYGNSGNVDARPAWIFLRLPRGVMVRVPGVQGREQLFNPAQLPSDYTDQEWIVPLMVDALSPGASASVDLVLTIPGGLTAFTVRAGIHSPPLASLAASPLTSRPVSAPQITPDTTFDIIGEVWDGWVNWGGPGQSDWEYIRHAVVQLPEFDGHGVTGYTAYMQLEGPTGNGLRRLSPSQLDALFGRMPSPDLQRFSGRRAFTVREIEAYRQRLDQYVPMTWIHDERNWKDFTNVRPRGNCVGILEWLAEQAGLRNGAGFIDPLLEFTPVIENRFAEAFGIRIPLIRNFAWLRQPEGALRPSDSNIPELTAALALEVVTSISPEDKFGPSGADDDTTSAEQLRRWVRANEGIPYRIDFWNREDAPAATQDVIVTDALDADLDSATFAFTGFGFLRWKVPIEPAQYFNVDVDLRPDFNLIVNVEATFDPEVRQIEWRFRSLDPITREPPDDPFAGFLPPITNSGYEIGWVDFAVSPRSGLPTGTEITNQSFVKFDVDVFKPAPPGGPFLNTLDASPPVSAMAPPGAVQNVTGFRVNWSGTDDGAGVHDYTVSVSANGGPFVVWQAGTTATSAVFPGVRGSQYAFHVVSRDHTGNTEAAKTSAEATTMVSATALLDTDLDGMTDDWETPYGLDPRSDAGADGPNGDPDEDGVTNADEFSAQTDPRLPNVVTLAEGATGSFFEERIALANPGPVPAHVTISYLQPDAAPIERSYDVGAQQRITIVVNDIPGLASADVSAVVRAIQGGVAVERTMAWDRVERYGGHTGKAVSAPRTQWYLAEGEANFFDTFILFTNPNDGPATITATYLLDGGDTVARTYVAAGHARLTVRANDDPALRGRPFSTTVTSTAPITVDRAMYFSTGGLPYAGGHASAAIERPSTSWFVAEGATGTFFDEFLLLANPNQTPVTATIRYLTTDGAAITRTYQLAPTSRTTVYVDGVPGLESVPGVSAVVEATAPIIVERAMYWPAFPWTEAHNSAGVVATGASWVLAEGEVGGPLAYATYLLLANPGAAPATVTLTFLRTGRPPLAATLTVPANTRVTRSAGEFQLEPGERFGVLVDSTAPIAVERAMYWNGGGVFWGAGTNETAIRLR
jgi:hypothetical protein